MGVVEGRALVGLHRRESGSGGRKADHFCFLTEAETAFAAGLGLDDSG